MNARTLTSERGFTLAEVLVASAMVGMVALTSLQVTDMMVKQSTLNEAKQGQIQLTKDLRDAVTHRDTCIKSLTTRRFDPDVDSDIGIRLSPGLIVAGSATKQKIDEYGVRVTSLKFTQKKRVASSGDTSYYSTLLELQSESLQRINSSNVSTSSGDVKKVQTGSAFAPRTVATLFLKIRNSDNLILDCLLGEDAEVVGQLTCASMGGVMADKKNCKLQPEVLSASCPAGQYLMGFANGKEECRKFPTPEEPKPIVKSCTNQDVRVGTGLGATPRYWPDPCNQSCYGTFGNDTRCGSGCYYGDREWYYCGNCVRRTQVCN